VGSVLEAKLDRGRGAVATVLVQDGTLRLNDSYIVGNTFGKVRAMFDDRGRPLEEAGPSPRRSPGLEAMPTRATRSWSWPTATRPRASPSSADEGARGTTRQELACLPRRTGRADSAGRRKDLALIIKGDVTGSVEVLADSLVRMSTEKVRVKVIHSGVGSITESDVLLATASNALIIGFNVRPSARPPSWRNRSRSRSGCTPSSTSCRMRCGWP